MTATRVLLISEIPTPYRLPLFARIAAHPEIELEVLFCAAEQPDRPWRLPTNRGFRFRVLRGLSLRFGRRSDTFVYEINPGIVARLARGGFDVLVISGYSVFAEQVALAWARLRRIPYIVVSESHLGKPRSALKRRVKELALPHLVGRAAAGLATGTRAAGYLHHYGLPAERIRILPNTIDVVALGKAAAAARVGAAEIRGRLGLPSRFLLYVGRLVERKGVLDLLEAHRLLGASAPPLVIAGVGPLAAEVDGAPGVLSLGFVQPDELPALYALAEAAVVPSHHEPWGVAVNEALACGCPVVASDAVGAAIDLVVDGRQGLVYPAGDVSALRLALERALAERDSFTPASGRVLDWDYDFGVAQFVEAVEIAKAARPRRPKSR
jgi:glycosyltransferase involved in cell wall biosynthesis